MREYVKIISASLASAVLISSFSLTAPAYASPFGKDKVTVPVQVEEIFVNKESITIQDKDTSNKENAVEEDSATLGYPTEKELLKAKAPKAKVKPLQVRYEYVPKDKDESGKKKNPIVIQEHMAFDTDGLTDEQIDWIMTAAKLSKQKIPAAFFRAVAEQESDITPDVFAMDRNGGTWGIWQINEYHVGRFYDGGDFSTDRNDNGTPDVQEPMIAAKIAAAYFDDLYLELEQMRRDYPNEKWAKELTTWEALAVAHNAGPTGMRKYPHFAVPEITDKYLNNMRVKIPLYMEK